MAAPKYTRFGIYKGEAVLAYCHTLEQALIHAAEAEKERYGEGVIEILASGPGIRDILDVNGNFVREYDPE